MISHILLDVEGTITDIEFVTNVLFPYARSRMADFIRDHETDAEVVDALVSVREFMNNDCATLDAIVNQCIQWIDEDRKEPALKTLQGLIWSYGYESGVLKGHVYEDAKQQIDSWHEAGLSLGIYSSGSVQAQKLLLRHSSWGDLTDRFSHHFDTNVGHKREMTSYQAIAQALGIRPTEILFLSDVSQELDAASFAGMLTCGVSRYGEGACGSHPTVTQLSEVNLQDFSLGHV